MLSQKEAEPDCNIRQIEMAEIAKEGGALHCISWNVYLSKSHVKRLLLSAKLSSLELN